MADKFKWDKIPKNPKGFVYYPGIPSPIVRKMVAEAETIKLREEYKARIQWQKTPANDGRLNQIEEHLNQIEYLTAEL